jgi:hypothetical protein
MYAKYVYEGTLSANILWLRQCRKVRKKSANARAGFARPCNMIYMIMILFPLRFANS